MPKGRVSSRGGYWENMSLKISLHNKELGWEDTQESMGVILAVIHSIGDMGPVNSHSSQRDGKFKSGQAQRKIS